MSDTKADPAAQAIGWLGNPVLDVAGSAITPFMLIRTVVVIALVWCCVVLVKRALSRTTSKRPELARSGFWLVAKLATWSMIVFGGLLVLSSLGLNLGKATLIMSALTVGIGFGLQNIVNNFVSGIILMFERSVRVGDWIEVGATSGIVSQMNVRSTVVSTFDKAEVIVPNSDMISNHVINWTLLDDLGRIVIDFEYKPGVDSGKVCALLEACAARHDDVCKGPNPPAPVSRLKDIGTRGIRVGLQCYVDDVMLTSRIRGELLADITARLDGEGVEIAFSDYPTPRTS